MRRPLLLLIRQFRRLMLAQAPPNRTSLFWSQVERQVLLLCVEEAQLLALVGIDNGKDAGNGFAEVVSGMGHGQPFDSIRMIGITGPSSGLTSS